MRAFEPIPPSILLSKSLMEALACPQDAMFVRRRTVWRSIAVASAKLVWVTSAICLGLLNAAYVAAHEGEPDHSHAVAASGEVMTTRSGTKMLPLAKSEDMFQFVVYGDRTGGVPAGLRVLEQAVVDTNLLDPDIVMTVGDLIQGYNETPQWLEQMAEYKEIMDRLNMSWFPVAGNHDVYWRGEGEAPQGQHDSNYEEHFGPLWYSFLHKNSGFIVLYSDEGDPESNRKAFNDGKLQMMSDEQLAFVDKALQELSGADHVFVFLHHPRWIGGGYTGGNWDLVHQKMVDAGNVSAVFAGHIHHMRYDGPTDGIEYFTLATTGGSLNGEIPDAGYLHHLNIVTVRQDRISVAALPIGAVMNPRDFTPEFLGQVELARSIRPVQSTEALVIQADGSVAGELSFSLQNPCSSPIAATIAMNAGTDRTQWRSTLDHQHFTLEPGESRVVRFAAKRMAESVEAFAIPSLDLQLELLSETARVRLEPAVAPIKLQLGEVPSDYFTNSSPHALVVNGEASAVLVDSKDIVIADGPITVEAWVRAGDPTGFNAILAKTQSSEYAFFSDEGVPQFDLNLDGTYFSAKATELLARDAWTHLAGVFDGEQVSLFVNGKRVASVPATGKRRTNALPLIIGADPDGRGQPTRAFAGMIDEVRLSKVAVYAEDFTPAKRHEPNDDTVLLLHFDKRVGPFVLDHSNSAAGAVLGSQSVLAPVER